MIELCEDCEYSVLVADLIATLMTYEKHGKEFILSIWCNSNELPFIFGSDSHFDFLQEGLRVESSTSVHYIWYDVMSYMRVDKK